MNKSCSKQFLQRIKFVKFTDLISFFPMLLGAFLSLFLKVKNKNIWLVCERKNEARDNGYWFFKYLCENHKEITAVYAIGKKSEDYNKVKNLGKVISFGTLKHWIYYFAARWNISSQKEGKPNPAICFIIEVYLGRRKNRIYLKHGIIKDAQRWIYYDVSKIKMMCCASKKEQRFIQDNFGYPPSSVKLVGLARFDNLLLNQNLKRQIVVMPTMREWLRTMSSDTLLFEKSTNFIESEYYLRWNSFLNNNDLMNALEENNIELLFYPHPSMQKYLSLFTKRSEYIKLASAHEYDMQSLLKDSLLLITDYSSIFFDFAYMRKPLIYYQFDYEKYRRGQYQEGYFSYKHDGFGPVVFEENRLVEYIIRAIKKSFMVDDEYKDRVNSFFAFNDCSNCQRIFKAIKEMESK